MDIRGNLYELEGETEESRKKEIERLMKDLGCYIEEIENSHMLTPFQLKNQKVSSHDHKSAAAKQLARMRRERKK